MRYRICYKPDICNDVPFKVQVRKWDPLAGLFGWWSWVTIDWCRTSEAAERAIKANRIATYEAALREQAAPRKRVFDTQLCFGSMKDWRDGKDPEVRLIEKT